MKESFDMKKASNLGPSFFLAALDEVGRGPLAGPVVAGGVYWSGTQKQLAHDLEVLEILGINDSKLLKCRQREEIIDLFDLNLKINQVFTSPIKEFNRFKFIISENDHLRIDEINILQASLEAMENCWLKFNPKKKGRILIDGNKLPAVLKTDTRAVTIIKGDQKSKFIGLASIIAKVYRDNLMNSYSVLFPGYGLERNAGYPTKAHKEAIAKLGVTPIHRKTFKGVKEFVSN